MINLVKNEIVKQYKKKSVIAITVIIMLSAIVLPLIPQTLDSDMISSIRNDSVQMANSLQDEINQLEKNKTPKNRAKIINLKADEAGYRLEGDGDFAYDDWRNRVIDEYRILKVKEGLIEEINKGLSKQMILENAIGYDPAYVDKLFEMTGAERAKELKKVQVELKTEKDIIRNKEYFKYLEREINRKDKSILDLKKELVKAEKVRDKTEGTVEEIKNLKEQIAKTERELVLDEYRLKNKISFEDKGWKNSTLKDMQKKLDDFEIRMMTKEEFMSNNMDNTTYEEYQIAYKATRMELKKQIEVDWYSLENNIPQMNQLKDARVVVNDGYNVYIILTVLIVIIIGGGIVANEFSNGTIRLLAIRPVKRWKILLAKLIALGLIGISVFIVSTIILMITSGIVYGFSGYGIPVLENVNGVVSETSFIGFLLQNIGVSLIGLVFMIGMVFLLSTVAKNTALAVGGSMAVYFASAFAVVVLGNQANGFLGNTPAPYIGESILNMIPGMKATFVQSGVIFNEGFGSMLLIGMTIVMIGVSFVVFIKRDIKN